MPKDATFVTKNFETAGGDEWDVGGKLNINAGGVLNVEAGGAIQFGGVAAKAVAAGSVAVTGATNGDVNTGLSAVSGVSASLGEDATLAGLFVTAALGGTAGHITLKVWKPTASGDATPILSTAAKIVNWTAAGAP